MPHPKFSRLNALLVVLLAACAERPMPLEPMKAGTSEPEPKTIEAIGEPLRIRCERAGGIWIGNPRVLPEYCMPRNRQVVQ